MESVNTHSIMLRVGWVMDASVQTSFVRQPRHCVPGGDRSRGAVVALGVLCAIELPACELGVADYASGGSFLAGVSGQSAAVIIGGSAALSAGVSTKTGAAKTGGLQVVGSGFSASERAMAEQQRAKDAG